ncbi:MAG: GNAT family N-acetyltransferase [Streptomyces sp.]
MIELRVLTPDDWASWRTLRLAALAEAPYAFKSPLAEWQGEGDREERWRALLSINGSRNFLALLGGRPAGMARGVPASQKDVVHLNSMWVGEHARGRGAGDLLVTAVEEYALGRLATTLRLTVAPANTHAIALYRRHGLRETGELGEVMPDGRRERVMTKTLAPG